MAAGMGVAFRAKPALKAAAAVAIEHGDLTALLYLQGYRQSEFAAGALNNQEITYILIALGTAVVVLVLVAA